MQKKDTRSYNKDIDLRKTDLLACGKSAGTYNSQFLHVELTHCALTALKKRYNVKD